MGKERLIEVLNDLVSVEIAAVTEYQQHAYLSEISRVTDLMEDFSMDEMSHLEWLSREVRLLGGTPTVTPKEVKHADESFDALVKRDIEVEAEAMRRLEDYIKVAEEEGDQKIKRLLREIYADEKTHHSTLNRLLKPSRDFLGRVNGFIDIGAGLILTGVFWLYFWIFQFYVSYLLDPRWAHNFAYPLFLIIVGLAYKAQKTSTDLLAAISSFTIIPTEAGIITGLQSTYAALSGFVILLVLLAVERGRSRELLFFQHRWRRWYKKHLLTFAYLFLMHIAFIFFIVRVFYGDLMQAALPPEPPWQPAHWSTASFNILVIPLGLMGMAERFRGTLRRKIGASKLGYWWSLGVIVVGIVTLQVTSKAWPRYLAPLVVVIAILIISIVAYRRALKVE